LLLYVSLTNQTGGALAHVKASSFILPSDIAVGPEIIGGLSRLSYCAWSASSRWPVLPLCSLCGKAQKIAAVSGMILSAASPKAILACLGAPLLAVLFAAALVAAAIRL
jgi:hypothetical protein